MKPPISVVIITKNAARHLDECLASVRRVSDDIVVLDSGSTDETEKIAAAHGARFILCDWQGFSATKNEGNSMAINDWILSLDADEILSDTLIHTIQQLSAQRGVVYVLDRHNYYAGKRIKYSHWSPDKVPRLFHRQDAKWAGDFVHEKLHHEGKSTRVLLDGPLRHMSYESWTHRKEKVLRYARLSAQERFQRGKRTNILLVILMPVAKFFITYFIHLGILDGRAGLEIALTDALQTYERHRILRQLQKDIVPECCK